MMKPPSPFVFVRKIASSFFQTAFARRPGGPDGSGIRRAPTLLLASVFMLAAVLGLVSCLRTPGFPPETVDFSQYEVIDERKAAFFGYLLPLIREANEEVDERRRRLERLSEKPLPELSWWDRRWLADLAERYGVEDFLLAESSGWELLKGRVDIVPASLSLAQAANESAWGTSRFATEGFNFFGQWCYVPGCGMVPARRDSGARHEVAAFGSPFESVQKYIHNLNTHEAYAELRQARRGLRAAQRPVTGLALAEELGNYSERGAAYISELQEMIEFNELSQYDAPPPET